MTTYYSQTLPGEEQVSRISLFQEKLCEKEICGALILQKADMFYFTGTTQQGWLYIPVQGEPLLMIFKDFQRAAEESGMKHVISIVSPKEIPATISSYGLKAPEKLGLEMDVITANHYFQFQRIFDRVNLADVSTDIRLLRAVKSE